MVSDRLNKSGLTAKLREVLFESVDMARDGIERLPTSSGRIRYALVARRSVRDHVEPHKGDMVKFWNVELWQPACRWHHDVVKQQLEQRYARGDVSVADLRLDSALAVRLTLDLLPYRGVGGYENFSAQGPVPVD